MFRITTKLLPLRALNTIIIIVMVILKLNIQWKNEIAGHLYQFRINSEKKRESLMDRIQFQLPCTFFQIAISKEWWNSDDDQQSWWLMQFWFLDFKDFGFWRISLNRARSNVMIGVWGMRYNVWLKKILNKIVLIYLRYEKRITSKPLIQFRWSMVIHSARTPKFWIYQIPWNPNIIVFHDKSNFKFQKHRLKYNETKSIRESPQFRARIENWALYVKCEFVKSENMGFWFSQ